VTYGMTSTEADPDEHQPRTYVTEVWCPPADNEVHRLHLPMKEPEPLPTPAPEADMTIPEPQAKAAEREASAPDAGYPPSAQLFWVERNAIVVASPEPELEAEP
jgi:hypothetical protein